MPKAPLPFLRRFAPEAGTPLAGGDEYIALRNLPGGAVCALVVKTPPHDAELLLRFADGKRMALPFAQGFLPANFAPPGTGFVLPVPAGSRLISIAVRPR